MRHWSCLLLRDILGLPDVSGYSILVQLQDSLAEPEPEETARGRSRILPSTEDAADRIPAVFSHNYKWRREWDFWPGTSPGYTDRTWFPDKMAYLVRAHYVRPIGQKLLAAILSRREARAPRLNLFSQRDSLE